MKRESWRDHQRERNGQVRVNTLPHCAEQKSSLIKGILNEAPNKIVFFIFKVINAFIVLINFQKILFNFNFSYFYIIYFIWGRIGGRVQGPKKKEVVNEKWWNV